MTWRHTDLALPDAEAVRAGLHLAPAPRRRTANGAMIGAYGDEDYGVCAGAASAFRAPEPVGAAQGLAAFPSVATTARRARRRLLG